MSITEADRYEMHAKFIEVFGDKVAHTAMGQMKPADWDSVARKSDIQILQTQIDALRVSFSHMTTAMWAMCSIMVAGFVGLTTLIIARL